MRVDVEAVAGDLRRLLVLGELAREALAHRPRPARRRATCSLRPPGAGAPRCPAPSGSRRWRRPGLPSSARSPSWPALSVSSNAACTCSGGCTLCTLTLTTTMPVFRRSSWVWTDLHQVGGDRVALLVRAPSRSCSCRRSRAPPTRRPASPPSSGSRFSNRKARASFSRYCTVKRMSTMFSSCGQHRRVAQAGRLR